MDAFELNKIAGATLGTILFVTVLHNVGNVLMSPTMPATPAYTVEGVEAAATTEKGDDKAAEGAGLPALLAAASAESGEKVVKKCAACHSFDKGGPNKVGPNLWGVVGGNKGAVGGYAYSEALKGKGGAWTVEDLDHFLTNPKDFVAGTKMSFAGLKSAEDRAAAIIYMNKQSDSPVALPSK